MNVDHEDTRSKRLFSLRIKNELLDQSTMYSLPQSHLKTSFITVAVMKASDRLEREADASAAEPSTCKLGHKASYRHPPHDIETSRTHE